MKYLEFSQPTGTGTTPQDVVLYDRPGGDEIVRAKGATVPNPSIPGNPDRLNLFEYPIVAPGTYLTIFRQYGHHGKPCLKFLGIKGHEDGPVPILQKINPRTGAKGTATGIRVHEEWKASWRGSAGCMTIEKPAAGLWKKFNEGEQVAVFVPDQEWFAKK